MLASDSHIASIEMEADGYQFELEITEEEIQSENLVSLPVVSVNERGMSLHGLMHIWELHYFTNIHGSSEFKDFVSDYINKVGTSQIKTNVYVYLLKSTDKIYFKKKLTYFASWCYNTILLQNIKIYRLG